MGTSVHFLPAILGHKAPSPLPQSVGAQAYCCLEGRGNSDGRLGGCGYGAAPLSLCSPSAATVLAFRWWSTLLSHGLPRIPSAASRSTQLSHMFVGSRWFCCLPGLSVSVHLEKPWEERSGGSGAACQDASLWLGLHQNPSPLMGCQI